MAVPHIRRAQVGRVLVAAALLVAAYALFQGRKQYIQTFFPRGPGGAPPPRLALPEGADAPGGDAPGGDAPGGGVPASGAGLAQAAFVRVALLDGVDRRTARELPNYDALCRRGVEVQVDVGFPTVSLPVQSVLWTGLTQQQSGIEFVQARIDPPPDGSLPAREPSSAAVSDSHPFIAQSFGFAQAWPALDIAPPALAEWKAGPFAFTALGLVGSSTRLVFVHMVGPDSAGHRSGRASAAFAAAARAADDLLGDMILIDRAAHGPSSLWLVVADHGHRAAGGHGGEEPDIRIVRGCLAGAGLPAAAAPRGHLVHMVDLSRALADALGRPPHARAAGRPLFHALTAPEQPGATLPHPGVGRTLLAALLVAAALAVSWMMVRRSWGLPWWWVVAYLSLVAIESAPTLSTPMIYRPLGQSIYVGALPGLCVLAIVAGSAARRMSAARVAVTQLLLPAALCAACALLAWRHPPLMPLWSAQLSVTMVLCFSGAAVVALACLAALVPFGSGPGSPPETPDTEP